MQILDKYYNELCEIIYQIPLDKNVWVNFSKKLLQILNASYIHIQAIDFAYNVLSFSNGIGPLQLEAYASGELEYLRYPIESDPRWGKFLDPERKGWYQCHTHVTEEFVQHSDLYQKILLPCGLRYVATHELIWDEKLCVFWSISTSQQRQPLNQQELAFLDRLLPHLKCVVSAQRHFYEFSLDSIVGYNLIDKLTHPIVLLNLSGQIVHYNQAMQCFLKNTEYIKIIEQRLVMPEAHQNRLLKILYQIEESFRYKQDQLKQFQDLKFTLVNSDNENIVFTISLLASEKEMSFFGIRPLVMLSFDTNIVTILKNQSELKNYSDINQFYYLDHDYLRKIYNLTKRESEVCNLFINGMNLEHIAHQLNITRSTMRTYFKNIFIKTRCTSQVELMQLLMRINMEFRIK